jgi:hypothetical protein
MQDRERHIFSTQASDNMPLKSLKGKKRALKVRRRRKLARLYKFQKVQRVEEIEHEEEAAMVAPISQEKEEDINPSDSVSPIDSEEHPEDPPNAGTYLVSTEEMVLCLVSLGFKAYILTLSDNNRAATTTVSRAAEMLRYFRICVESAVIIACIVTFDPAKLLAYIKHLGDNLGRSSSTIYNIIIDLKTVYEWAIIFHAPAHLHSGFYIAMQIQLKKQLKIFRKKKKADAVKIR